MALGELRSEIMFYQTKRLSFKIGLSTSKKDDFICFNESHLKIIKNAFYFILKALFVVKIFKFLS